MKINQSKAIVFALLAATLYAISSPLSKILLNEIPPVMMAALLYLGAGTGMLVVYLLRKHRSVIKNEAGLSKKDIPFIIGMILLDIAAPVFLMVGLNMTTAENVSLLNNFEIVSTVLIAMIVFKEHIGKKLWIAIGLISISSLILSIDGIRSFSLSLGSVFVLIACVCWGFENNFTRMISARDPMQIVIIKGFGSGTGSLLIALFLNEIATDLLYISLTLVLGFFAYGFSIYCYVKAQRLLGAAKTSAYYAVAPFIGVALSLLVFREKPTWAFVIALLIMALGTCFVILDKHKHFHTHTITAHEHLHSHEDIHHAHQHTIGEPKEHSHLHSHSEIKHSHEHSEDIHHIHIHKGE